MSDPEQHSELAMELGTKIVSSGNLIKQIVLLETVVAGVIRVAKLSPKREDDLVKMLFEGVQDRLIELRTR